MDCIFCNIIKGDSAAEILYRDDKVISFLDIRPVNLGHTLVVPIEHHSNFEEMPDDLLAYMFPVLRDISIAVKKGTGAEGFNVICNNGKTAGQTVFHCHYHIIPRFDSDLIRYKIDFKSYSREELNHYGNLIRNSLRNNNG